MWMRPRLPPRTEGGLGRSPCNEDAVVGSAAKLVGPWGSQAATRRPGVVGAGEPQADRTRRAAYVQRTWQQPRQRRWNPRARDTARSGACAQPGVQLAEERPRRYGLPATGIGSRAACRPSGRSHRGSSPAAAGRRGGGDSGLACGRVPECLLGRLESVDLLAQAGDSQTPSPRPAAGLWSGRRTWPWRWGVGEGPPWGRPVRAYPRSQRSPRVVLDKIGR
jgi:hypothetical protein